MSQTYTERRQERLDHAGEFVAHMSVVRANPGTRSEMQRGLGRHYTELHALVPHVAPYARGPRSARYYAVATYVGAFGAGRKGVSLGHAVHLASRRAGVSAATIKRQLAALEDLTEEALLADRLPLLLRRLRSLGIFPDMALLLDDLRSWDYRSDRVLFGWIEDAVLGPERVRTNDDTPIADEKKKED